MTLPWHIARGLFPLLRLSAGQFCWLNWAQWRPFIHLWLAISCSALLILGRFFHRSELVAGKTMISFGSTWCTVRIARESFRKRGWNSGRPNNLSLRTVTASVPIIHYANMLQGAKSYEWRKEVHHLWSEKLYFKVCKYWGSLMIRWRLRTIFSINIVP